MGVPGIRRAVVIGTGLIGTSVALALRRAGVHVGLSDPDPEALAGARRRGAGTALCPGDPPADVVIVAAPPSAVPAVLRDAQRRRLGAVYTDVASTKSRICAEAAALGVDLATYLPGHPVAGGERPGPAAARADLFQGRTWVLCPLPGTPGDVLRTGAGLAALCGAVPRRLEPGEHDRILATVSHLPHLVAAALAARFATDADGLPFAGKGLRDTTRIAAGAPGLWCDILEHNAPTVADALDALIHDLTTAARALRGHTDPTDPTALHALLTRGNHGHTRIHQSSSDPRPDPGTAKDGTGLFL